MSSFTDIEPYIVTSFMKLHKGKIGVHQTNYIDFYKEINFNSFVCHLVHSYSTMLKLNLLNLSCRIDTIIIDRISNILPLAFSQTCVDDLPWSLILQEKYYTLSYVYLVAQT
jgi:hypothetical protein